MDSQRELPSPILLPQGFGTEDAVAASRTESGIAVSGKPLGASFAATLVAVRTKPEALMLVRLPAPQADPDATTLFVTAETMSSTRFAIFCDCLTALGSVPEELLTEEVEGTRATATFKKVVASLAGKPLVDFEKLERAPSRMLVALAATARDTVPFLASSTV